MRRLSRLASMFFWVAALGVAGCTMPTPTETVAPDTPVTVALLVPTGSSDADNESLGQSLINAAELAKADLSGVEIDLKIYGTAGDQTTAANVAAQAVAEGADIILGPFFSDATAAVAPVAEGAGTLVLSFSNNTAVAGGNVYLLGLTFDNIANRITSFAATRGLTQIGVVYPAGIEGETARDTIRQAAARSGSSVVVAEAYPFSVEGIAERGAAIASTVRSSGANALVLTDGPTGGLPFISETLRGLGVRPQAVQFLGMQRWNVSQEALAQPGLQGGWFVAPDPALSVLFADRYSARFGSEPHPLSGLAYDGVAAVGALVAEARAEGANDPFTTARLTAPSGFAGVNGVFRFLPDGQTERALTVFEVIEGDARPIDPAPRSFAATGS